MKWLLPIALLAASALSAEPYKIALVGLNHDHVWNQLNTILRGDLAKLVGVAETLPDRVERIEHEEKLAQGGATRPAVPASLVFSDWRKMIDQTKPDIVWAFVETNRHLEVVQYCAPRGIHVMFEYPLSVSVHDALEIRQLAHRYNTQVLTNYVFWAWTAPPYAAKAAVDSGMIGQVYRLRGLLGHNGPEDFQHSTFLTWLMDDNKNGGGALIDFGAPLVAWAVWMKGRPASVYAHVDHLRPAEFNGVDDNSAIILNYNDGIAILEGTWDQAAAPATNDEIYGRAGSMILERNAVDLYQRDPAGPKGGRGALKQSQLPIPAQPPELTGALAYMTDRVSKHQQLEGMSGLDLNVNVVEIF